VQIAPNCSAICQKGCMWGFCSPTGNILLNTILHPASTFFCSTANIFLTSASFNDRCAKKLACILSITCSFQKINIMRHVVGGIVTVHYFVPQSNVLTAREEASVPSSGRSSRSSSSKDGPGRPNCLLLMGKYVYLCKREQEKKDKSLVHETGMM
jgi:hypothetical protein